MTVHENPFRYNKLTPAVANSQRYVAHFSFTAVLGCSRSCPYSDFAGRFTEVPEGHPGARK